RTGQEHAVRDTTPEHAVLLWMAQEIDDLRQLGLRLVDAGDVGKRDTVARRLIAARARAPEGAEEVLRISRAAHQPEEQEDEQDRRPESEQQALPPRPRGVERLRVHDDLLLLQQGRQGVGVRECRYLGLEAG